MSHQENQKELKEEELLLRSLLTGSPSIKVKDVMVMIKSILGDKISLEFKDEEIKGHYGLTRYSFRPKIAEKYISNDQIDLGQGLLDTIFEVYKEADEAGEKLAFDFDIQDISRDFGYLTSVDVIHQPKSFISKIKNWMGV